MHTEEQEQEGISVNEEKMIKKVSTIIMVLIIVLGILITTDIILVTKANIGPVFAIKTNEYNDGGTKEYYGLGYKVIKYNQKIGRRDTTIGTWSLKYNITPEEFNIVDLAYSIINDNKTYQRDFIKLTGTITSKNNKDNTITLKFEDEEEGKYNLTVRAKLLSDNIKKLNTNAPVSIIGTVTNYNKTKKMLTITNAFAE